MLGIILFLAALGLSPSGWAQSAGDPNKGTFDFRGRNLESEFITIEGDWPYYWGRHLTPEDLLVNPELRPDGYFTVPGFWTNQAKYLEAQDPERQLITYQFSILIDQQHPKTLVIGVPEIPSAYKIFMNGNLVLSNGMLGESRNSTVPGGRNQHFLINDAPSRLDFLVQVSNFHHLIPGIWFPFTFSSYETFVHEKDSHESKMIFIIGWLTIMGIYHIILYLLRKQNKAPLYFGLFCLAVAVRTGVVDGDGLVHFLLPNLGWHWGKRVEYFTFLWSAPFLITFCWQLYPKEIFTWMMKTSWLPAITLSIPILFLETQQFNFIMPYFQIYIGIVSVTLIANILLACYRKRNGALIFMGGILVILLGLANDMLKAAGIIESIEIAQFGVAGFTFCQAYLIAKLFSNAFAQVEEGEQKIKKLNANLIRFNEELEHQVELKTRKVRSLLDHIPQGVLSIGEDGIVGENCSAHLIDVLEEDISGQSFKESVLDKAEASSDKMDQAWQVILTCVGEDAINFEVNDDKFPTELTIKVNGNVKHIKVTWNIEEVDGLVESILVTLLDITQEKKLEQEAEEQRREIHELIQLIRIPEAKAEQFFNTSELLLNEIHQKLKASHGKLPLDTARMIFVNAHTVKGAARTLHLTDLAEAVHDMEETYSSVIQNHASLPIEVYRKEFEAVRAVFNEYKRINIEELNRSMSNNSLLINKNFVEDHYHLLKDILNDPNEQNFLQSLYKQSEEIARMIFENLPDICQQYAERAVKVAKDLSKLEPTFAFNIPNISITSNQRNLLDKCMIHIIRNALDHGIELPEVRERLGKKPRGEIGLNIHANDTSLELIFWDDGRGIAIESLRSRGIEKGMLLENASLKDIAETIFSSGVSTAESVTEISGRGVGMDAVKTFLEMEGGHIEILLGDEIKETPGYYRFKFKLWIPSQIEEKKAG